MVLRVVGAALLVGLSWFPGQATACGNAVTIKTRDAARLLLAAEQALDRGDHKQALAMLGRRNRGRVPDLADDGESLRMPRHPGGFHVADPALNRRWSLLLTVAQLRAGTVPAAQVARSLEEQAKKSPGPYVEARIAEALAADEGTRPAALEKLTRLEKRDLIPDPEGYALLASLRHASGDAPGRDRALERCRKMAGRKRAAMCAAPADAGSQT
jgi:hypothetical protein